MEHYQSSTKPKKARLINKLLGYATTGILAVFFLFVGASMVFAQLDYIDTDSPNFAQNEDDILESDVIDGNPIRQGTYLPVQSPDQANDIGIINPGEIQTYEQGQLQTLNLIKRIVNYFLGFLGLIALVIFMYAGARVVTAGADDQKFQDAIKDFRKVALAIGGIGVSWFIVTFIFFVIQLIIS